MKKFKILIVDDEKINIEILRNTLKQKYEVYAAINGEQAIKISDKIRPDLILLDIMMPDLSGYEVIKKIKEMPYLKEIPIIFLSANDGLESKEKGFSLGAADYITKPFEIAEVLMRLKVQLELLNSKREVKLLLSKTLSGSVQVLFEVLSIVHPTVFALSTEIKDIVKIIIKNMNLSNKWMFELSAMLYYIGCFPIKDEMLQKIINEEEVSVESKALFDKHPELGSKIIKKIPRLEDIAEIIGSQGKELGKIETNDEKIICEQVLEVAKYFAISRLRQYEVRDIIEKLRNNENLYKKEIVDILANELLDKEDNVYNKEKESVIQELYPDKLVEGMVLVEDVYSSTGDVLVKKGAKITGLLKEHLKLMYELNEIKGKITVT